MPVASCITLAAFDMMKYLKARNALGLTTSINAHDSGSLRLEHNQAEEQDWDGVLALSAWVARTDPHMTHRRAFVVKSWNERIPGATVLYF